MAAGMAIYVVWHGWPGAAAPNRTGAPHGAQATPDPSQPIALVGIAGKSLSFSPAQCTLKSGVLQVSYGTSRDAPTYLSAVIVLGPVTADGHYAVPYVTRLVGHQQGADFDLKASTATVRLSGQLTGPTPPGMKEGYWGFSIYGVDQSGETLTASVVCGRSPGG
jgi:hypothetical protein